MRWMFTLLLKEVYAEKTDMEENVSNGYANLMFVRPGRLTKGDLTRKYRVYTSLDRSTRIRSISRKDVAHFKIDQVRNPTCIGKYPALSY